MHVQKSELQSFPRVSINLDLLNYDLIPRSLDASQCLSGIFRELRRRCAVRDRDLPTQQYFRDAA